MYALVEALAAVAEDAAAYIERLEAFDDAQLKAETGTMADLKDSVDKYRRLRDGSLSL